MVPANGRLPTYAATRVWFPRHGLEPAISWMWGSESHLHSRWPRAYGPARSLRTRAGASPPRLIGLPCLFGFEGAESGPSGKKKGPGVARPLVNSLG